MKLFNNYELISNPFNTKEKNKDNKLKSNVSNNKNHNLAGLIYIEPNTIADLAAKAFTKVPEFKTINSYANQKNARISCYGGTSRELIDFVINGVNKHQSVASFDHWLSNQKSISFIDWHRLGSDLDIMVIPNEGADSILKESRKVDIAFLEDQINRQFPENNFYKKMDLINPSVFFEKFPILKDNLEPISNIVISAQGRENLPQLKIQYKDKLVDLGAWGLEIYSRGEIDFDFTPLTNSTSLGNDYYGLLRQALRWIRLISEYPNYKLSQNGDKAIKTIISHLNSKYSNEIIKLISEGNFELLENPKDPAKLKGGKILELISRLQYYSKNSIYTSQLLEHYGIVELFKNAKVEGRILTPLHHRSRSLTTKQINEHKKLGKEIELTHRTSLIAAQNISKGALWISDNNSIINNIKTRAFFGEGIYAAEVDNFEVNNNYGDFAVSITLSDQAIEGVDFVKDGEFYIIKTLEAIAKDINGNYKIGELSSERFYSGMLDVIKNKEKSEIEKKSAYRTMAQIINPEIDKVDLNRFLEILKISESTNYLPFFIVEYFEKPINWINFHNENSKIKKWLQSSNTSIKLKFSQVIDLLNKRDQIIDQIDKLSFSYKNTNYFFKRALDLQLKKGESIDMETISKIVMFDMETSIAKSFSHVSHIYSLDIENDACVKDYLYIANKLSNKRLKPSLNPSVFSEIKRMLEIRSQLDNSIFSNESINFLIEPYYGRNHLLETLLFELRSTFFLKPGDRFSSIWWESSEKLLDAFQSGKEEKLVIPQFGGYIPKSSEWILPVLKSIVNKMTDDQFTNFKNTMLSKLKAKEENFIVRANFALGLIQFDNRLKVNEIIPVLDEIIIDTTTSPDSIINILAILQRSLKQNIKMGLKNDSSFNDYMLNLINVISKERPSLFVDPEFYIGIRNYFNEKLFSKIINEITSDNYLSNSKLNVNSWIKAISYYFNASPTDFKISTVILNIFISHSDNKEINNLFGKVLLTQSSLDYSILTYAVSLEMVYDIKEQLRLKIKELEKEMTYFEINMMPRLTDSERKTLNSGNRSYKSDEWEELELKLISLINKDFKNVYEFVDAALAIEPYIKIRGEDYNRVIHLKLDQAISYDKDFIIKSFPNYLTNPQQPDPPQTVLDRFYNYLLDRAVRH